MTDPVDDRIRDHMRDSFPREHDSSLVLEELRPKMLQARNRRRAAQASLGVATLSAVVIGVLLVLPQFGESSSQLDVAGSDGSGTVVESEDPSTVESPATTDDFGRTIEESAERGPDVAPSSPSTTADAVTPTEPSTTPAPTSIETTTTASQTSTTAAPNTDPTSTTTTAPTEGLILTPCGSVLVEIVGSGIRLVSTNPDPGFEVEVKDSGPDQIEVGFEGEEVPHCEVIAENRNGQIWSSVDDEDGHDD